MVKKQNDSPSEKQSVLIQTASAIENCVKLSIDSDRYGYTYMKNFKKIKSGAFTINVRIYAKHSPSEHKSLLFIVDRDIKTALVHVSIVDNSSVNPSVLFTASDLYPVIKIEKYVPSIISSTQNMISK